MDFLLEPNIAYLILLGSILVALMAIVVPGTGFLEVGAFFGLVLSGYAVYSLSFNWWALIVLLLSLIPFVYSIQKPKRELFLGLSIFLLVIGSVFLFDIDGWKPAVDPLIAFFASGLMAVFLWVMARKAMQAAGSRPTHDLDVLIGAVGEARSRIHKEGSVYVAGEMWSARSDVAIPDGSSIRVLQREGFILVVEKVGQLSNNQNKEN
jgi:membrane-bound serine protease (ClpP class)